MEEQLARVQTLQASIDQLESSLQKLRAQLTRERNALRVICQHTEYITVQESDYYHTLRYWKCTACGFITDRKPLADITNQ